MQAVQDWYLSAMGIVRYVPKDQLCPENLAGVEIESFVTSLDDDIPASSTEATVSAETQGMAQQPVSGAAAASPPNSRNSARALLAELDGKPAAPIKANVVDEQPPVATAQSEKTNTDASNVSTDVVDSAESDLVSFQIACWQPSDDLLIFNDLVSDSQTSSAQRQLLNNILRAIGRMQEPMGNGERLVSADVPGQANRANASIQISTFLASRIKARGVCWVLLMGAAASDFIDGEKQAGNYQWGDKIQLPGGATGFVLPSLGELLNDSALKKTVWQAIAHLVS